MVINNNLLKSSRSKAIAQLHTLESLLHLTRSEAITLFKPTYLCPTEDQKKCSNVWNNIMIFTLDHNNNLELLFYFHQVFGEKLDRTAKINFFGSYNQEQKIKFLPNGITFNNGHFCIDPHQTYCLYMNQAGKTYIKIARNKP